jgi:hypothetical protein
MTSFPRRESLIFRAALSTCHAPSSHTGGLTSLYLDMLSHEVTHLKDAALDLVPPKQVILRDIL